jgi:hypothetical protein
MKQLLIKYAPILIALTALADTQMELLSQIGLSDTAIAWIKLSGLLLALFLPSVKESFKPMKRELENSDPFNTNIPKGTKI